MTVHEWDPSCFRDLTSIPCWYEWYLTLTSSTGPIFHVSSNPSLSEQNHHSQVTCIIGMLQHLQLHPPGDILIKPAVSPAMINRMSSGSVSNLPLWLRNKFTCAGTLIASGFVKSDKTSGETLQSNCSFDCRYGFLRAEKRMILDLLSQFFTPIRDRSEDTELVDGSGLCEMTTARSIHHRCSESTTFLLSCFSTSVQRTCCSKDGMSTWSEMKHHHLRRLVPQTVWPVGFLVRGIPMSLLGICVREP